MILLTLLSCTEEPVVVPTRPALPPPLELPDVTGIDFESAYLDAVTLALSVDARTLFGSHGRSVERFTTSCPDVYGGLPPESVADVDLRNDAEGFTWADHCVQDDGTFFSGFGYWDGSIQASGSPGTPEGLTIDASRVMVADGVRGDDTGTVFEFDGAASDAMSTTVADDYTRWSYTSLIEGTSTGTDPFPAGALATHGWRTDLYIEVLGGDVERIETRGNVYLFDGRLHDRFDSVAVDLDIIGALGAGPDDCLEEPLGWIGLRDENAVWYDLVFLPRSSFDVTAQPYPNDPLQECDGCGTLYIRGVEQGTVCPDLSGLLSVPEPPVVDDFVQSIRQLPHPDPSADGGPP